MLVSFPPLSVLLSPLSPLVVSLSLSLVALLSFSLVSLPPVAPGSLPPLSLPPVALLSLVPQPEPLASLPLVALLLSSPLLWLKVVPLSIGAAGAATEGDSASPPLLTLSYGPRVFGLAQPEGSGVWLKTFTGGPRSGEAALSCAYANAARVTARANVSTGATFFIPGSSLPPDQTIGNSGLDVNIPEERGKMLA